MSFLPITSHNKNQDAKKLIHQSDLISLVAILIFKSVLELFYYLFVVPYYAYALFELNFSWFNYLLGTFTLIMMFFAMPRDNKPASFVLQTHLMLIIIPMISYFSLSSASIDFMALSCLVFFIECFIVRVVPAIRITRIRHSALLFYLIVGVITVAVYSIMIRANGVSFSALNLNVVYDIRENLKYPLGMRYLVPWQAKVINPFLIAIGFNKKKPTLFVGAFLLQLLLYLVAPNRSFLLIPFVIIAVMWLVKRFHFLSAASAVGALGVSLLLVFHNITNNISIPSLLIRRLFFLPAQIKFFWFEFFSDNPKLNFSQGTIGSIFGIADPYGKTAGRLIGELVYGKPDMNANSGYLSDAFANGGISAMIIIGILLGISLVLLNSLSQQLGFDFVIGISIFHVIALNDGSFQTNFLTGGFGLLLFLLYLYSSGKIGEDANQTSQTINPDQRL